MKIEAKDVKAGQMVRFPFGGWQEVREATPSTHMTTIVTDMAYCIPMTAKVHVK